MTKAMEDGHTDMVMDNGTTQVKISKQSWLYDQAWRVFPIAAVVVLRAAREIIFGGIRYWRWWDDVFIVVGWLIGWMLAEIDHLFYVTVCNPQELTCQRVKRELEIKNFRAAWRLMEDTRGERTRLPVRNMLTGIIIAVVGVWIVTSSGSPLGSGVVMGLGVRLFSEVLTETNWKKWYWIFAREFSEGEHKWLMLAWGAALVWQALMLIRG